MCTRKRLGRSTPKYNQSSATSNASSSSTKGRCLRIQGTTFFNRSSLAEMRTSRQTVALGRLLELALNHYATAQQHFPRLPRWLQGRHLREPNGLRPVEHPLTAVSRQEPFTQNGIKKFGVGEVIKDHWCNASSAPARLLLFPASKAYGSVCSERLQRSTTHSQPRHWSAQAGLTALAGRCRAWCSWSVPLRPSRRRATASMIHRGPAGRLGRRPKPACLPSSGHPNSSPARGGHMDDGGQRTNEDRFCDPHLRFSFGKASSFLIKMILLNFRQS